MLPAATLPVNASCSLLWTSLCRITIHYEMHIHPMWSADRTVDANMDGMPDRATLDRLLAGGPGDIVR